MRTPRASSPNGPRRLPGVPTFGLPSTGAPQAANFGWWGLVGGLAAVAALVGGLVWSAVTGLAPASERPRIFGGSLVLDDYRPLTVVNLATGSVTVQLVGVYAQVGASTYSQVQAVPTTQGTVLVNRLTGTFNLLGKDNYVLGPPVGGISLGPLAGLRAAVGLANGATSYIVRYGPHSTVSLVGPATAEAAAGAVARGSHLAVPPLGFAKLAGPAYPGPGTAATRSGALWLLEVGSPGCLLVRLAPSPRAPLGLSATTVARLPLRCARASLETTTAGTALALPGRVELFGGSGRLQVTMVPGTQAATAFLPVKGAGREAWFLARGPSGWTVFGTAGDRRAVGPSPLAAFGPASRPTVPALSGGRLYTLDQAQPGQPTLWTIDPATGAMRPLAGAPSYPAKSVTEKASFQGAEVLVDGPRVIFNNPGSLLAVVVFTDGSHAPVVIDKSDAVVVSAAGPGDVNVKAKGPKHHRPGAHRPRPPARHRSSPKGSPATTTSSTVPATVPPRLAPLPAQPAVQPISQQISCATTTEKPYQPQVTSVAPSDQSALVSWSYHLLSEQDCLPSTWAVTVSALGGAPQPAVPTQVVNGQQQLLVTGLRPGTEYQAVVTAYIAKQSTSSAPYMFRTTALGPGPPSRVTELADGRGGWLVSWEPCQGTRCNVPAARWRVVGTACGGSYVGQPPVLDVGGGQSSVTVNQGNDLGLLGSSLTFSVQGVSSAGLVGAPTSAGRCSQAWQPPDPADLRLLAAGLPAGGTVSAELSVAVAPGVPQAIALGGDQVEYTFEVAGKALGPTTSPQVEVTGLQPAKTYQATVSLSPLGHPQAAVSLTSPPFTQTLPWPRQLRMEVSALAGANASTGTAVASFPGLPPGSFEATGDVTCASVVAPVHGPVTHGQFTATIDLDQMGGPCRLSLRLDSALSPDPYGLPSPVLVAPFSIGSPPAYSFSALAASPCTSCRHLELYVSYSGSGQPAGTDWDVTAAAPGPSCSATSGTHPVAQFPVSLAWPLSCPAPLVTVSWLYLGQAWSADASLAAFVPPTTTSTPAPAPPTSVPAAPPPSPSPSTTRAPTQATTTAATAPVTTAPPTTAPTTTGATGTTTTTTTATGPTTTTAASTTTTTGATTTTTSASTTTTAAPTTTTSPTTTTTGATTTTTSASTTTTTAAPTTTTSSTTTTTAPSSPGTSGAVGAALVARPGTGQGPGGPGVGATGQGRREQPWPGLLVGLAGLAGLVGLARLVAGLGRRALGARPHPAPSRPGRPTAKLWPPSGAGAQAHLAREAAT